jgi:DNA-directed RNA polymerase specialized sigma24 family protein
MPIEELPPEGTDEIVVVEPTINEPEHDKLLTALRNCIDTLSDTRKKIIMAYYYRKMSMNEIADEYNFANADSVKVQKYKAVKDLKKCRELSTQKQN